MQGYNGKDPNLLEAGGGVAQKEKTPSLQKTGLPKTCFNQ